MFIFKRYFHKVMSTTYNKKRSKLLNIMKDNYYHHCLIQTKRCHFKSDEKDD